MHIEQCNVVVIIKGQLQWEKNSFFIPSIDRGCDSDAQEKKIR